MDYDLALRAEIEKYMRVEGVSQLELAKRTGMSPQYISDVLTGRRGKLPSSIAAILDALQLELIARPR